MKKRIISVLACVVIAAGATLGLTGCSDKGITVWGAQNQQTMLREMVQIFLDRNPDFNIPINVGVCGEDVAYSTISADPEASADVFGYVNDQLARLKTIGAVAQLGQNAAAKMLAENTEEAASCAEIDGSYYGYPYAADNGFFLYYDSSVISETAAGSLEGILRACQSENKYFIFNQRESWYVGTFFFGAGGSYDVEWDNITVKKAASNFGECPEGSEYSYGEIGAMAHIDLNENRYFVNGDDTVIDQYLTGGNFGACISGTWNAEKIEKALGKNYAATKLPTFTSSLTGETYNMSSFKGYKLYGVNQNTKHPAEAHKLAAFLASEEMQELRFDTLQTGPTNKNVAALDKVQNNVALKALNEQAPYAILQLSMPDSYWNAMLAFGEGVNGTKPEITRDNYVSKVKDFIEALEENNDF